MASKSLTGACLCGKITYRVDLPADAPSPKVPKISIAPPIAMLLMI